MNITGKARQLERTLTRSVEAAIGELVGREDATPLEIVHAVLDRAELQVIEMGRGRRVFPFNRVTVQIAGARAKDAKARVEAVLAGPPSVGDRLEERLRHAGCGTPAVTVRTVFVAAPASGWGNSRFNVVFDRVAEVPSGPPPLPVPAVAPRLKLTVVKGRAGQRVYVFSGGRIDIGRQVEVVDRHQRVLRTNHVAFAEEAADENLSVSRRHAHITFEERDGAYRIWDDRSARGTSIVRGGRTVRVPASARGTRLLAGDEIVLGRARVRVAID
ncbi:MAG TPA: FHA domain-containing protein [Vicinamibacterales bacterium]|nr:FHA domain-containing protein [Vicinamibacterales bacterium]